MTEAEEDLHCWVPTSAPRPARCAGGLSGHSVAVKDMIALAGHRSSYGLAAWRATHPPSETTAPVLERLLDAGAAIAGVGKLDELAYSLEGNTGEGIAPLNPRYPDRFAGGSSSGPASAVAGRAVDIGLGTDTAGSIRVPSAGCGLFGLRPTHGVLDTTGVLPLAPSFDTVGLMCIDPALLAQSFAIACGDGTDRPRREISRIRFPRDCVSLACEEAARAIRSTVETLSEVLGCAVDTSFAFADFVSDESASMFANLVDREIWQTHGAWVREHRDAFHPLIAGRLRHAEKVSDMPADQQRAEERTREVYRERMNSIVEDGSVIVLPVMPHLPPSRHADDAELAAYRLTTFRLTAPAGLSGCPQLVVPTSGRAFGVGILAGHNAESALLDAAVRYADSGGTQSLRPRRPATHGRRFVT
ncbi:amidase family protein [Nocardia sp. CNY236]|uniref:amidase family protein n=1 Tax=Nocardia sp. CNY236 TaxID=1169152 RepID=UPI000687324A|nr:amidase family protein [Nocardia sp. CNY236]